MARKDLSRTVIEGGRSYYNSQARRASHGVERARTRAWLDHVRVDLEAADGTIARRASRVGKSFHDKLAPAKRWLASQVGRPWSKVFSELCREFDTRTVAGRHVVHDHMLRWVLETGAPAGGFWREREFFIDRHGILRRSHWFGRSYAKLRKEALAWAAGRTAVMTPRGWYWYQSRANHASPCRLDEWSCRRQHHYGRFTPLGPMSRGDVKRLARLPDELRTQIVLVMTAVEKR